MKKNAAKIVTDAILGHDAKLAMVNGKVYSISPPTIHRLAGAANCLCGISGNGTVAELLSSQSMESAARALSYFIADDLSLVDELSKGTLPEVVGALAAAYSLVSVQDFWTLSALARNVASLAAKQRP